jgi:hypothetical protein
MDKNTDRPGTLQYLIHALWGQARTYARSRLNRDTE